MWLKSSTNQNYNEGEYYLKAMSVKDKSIMKWNQNKSHDKTR